MESEHNAWIINENEALLDSLKTRLDLDLKPAGIKSQVYNNLDKIEENPEIMPDVVIIGLPDLTLQSILWQGKIKETFREEKSVYYKTPIVIFAANPAPEFIDFMHELHIYVLKQQTDIYDPDIIQDIIDLAKGMNTEPYE